MFFVIVLLHKPRRLIPTLFELAVLFVSVLLSDDKLMPPLLEFAVLFFSTLLSLKHNIIPLSLFEFAVLFMSILLLHE